MNEEPKLSLPGSGYEQVAKILHAYALCGDKPVALDEVASKAGMNATIVSRNNGFLVSLGLLTGGRAKNLTPAGKELALALGHDLQEDAAISWRRAFVAATAAKPILDMLRVQRSVPIDAFPARIAAALGLPDTPSTKTGTNTLIEIMRKAGLLKEEDGKVMILDENPRLGPDVSTTATGPATPVQTLTTQPSTSPRVNLPPEILPSSRPNTDSPIPIHVNIELHLPASAEQSVYDALFKSIRENLLNR